MILAAIPASLVQLFETSNLTSLIAAILLALPALLVDLYVNMADVAFYEILKGNLVVLNPQPEYEQRTPGKEE